MRRQLSKSEVKDLLSRLPSGYLIDKKDRAELVSGEHEVLYLDGVPCFFFLEKDLIPTLKLLQTNDLLKKITVDMGAVRFGANGADVMRPGITQIGPGIMKGELVVIRDVKNNKSLAVGRALFSSEEMAVQTQGKVIRNLHYIGDDLWKSF
jgi:PUA-domain protein